MSAPTVDKDAPIAVNASAPSNSLCGNPSSLAARQSLKPPIAPKPARIINGRVVMLKELREQAPVVKENEGDGNAYTMATMTIIETNTVPGEPVETASKNRSESESEQEPDQAVAGKTKSKLACVTEECITFIESVLKALCCLMNFKEALFTEFQSNREVFIYLSSAFREIQPLKMVYQMMVEKIDVLSTNGSFCLSDLFLDTEVRATLKVYKAFLQQYSLNTKWFGEFHKSNTVCQEICRLTKEKHEMDDTTSVDSCFYTIFSSLFSLQLIIDRYMNCFEDGDESYKKATEVKSVITDLLNVINTNLDQEQFLVTHKEINLIAGRTRETKITTRFIFKGEAIKLSRRDDKILPRLLILFSDCLYVTLLPGNISGMCSARQELSLDNMVVSILPEDEEKGSNLKWGLNIYAREANQDFFFEDETTMNTWLTKLQSAIGNMSANSEEKLKSNHRPKIGDEAPRWQKDGAAKYCNGLKCNQVFSHTTRRHHCRADGLLYCDACCSLKIKLKFERSPESRVCDICHRILLGDLNRPLEFEEAKRQLEFVFDKKTRKGKKVDWLNEHVYNREKSCFGPSTKFYCELDSTDPFLKMYERQEDKCKHHGIMLLGMIVRVKKESNLCKKLKPFQFIIEHQDKDEAYLFDAQSVESCDEWVRCLRESISDYCNK